MAAEKAPDPFHHLTDTEVWHFLSEHITGGEGFHIPLPYIPIPYFNFANLSFQVHHYQITKLMLLEVIAGALMCIIFIPLARRIAAGGPPKGFFWNTFEVLLTFIRETVARPTLYHEPAHHHEEHGEHHGGHHHEDPHAEVDRYVPYLWTVFLFILFCNLLGLIPFMGSPTANIWVTGALALCSFLLLHGAATMKMGFVNYMKALWPGMEIPMGMGYLIKPMIFSIELFGTFIKSVVLAVRLFANLMAGHLVLAVILMFIVMANPATSSPFQVGLWGGITVASVLGVVALSILELFVAFLQAFIFVFLTSLFLGMAIHPEH